jgi:putative YphP/YqiW family bacilliredoxin
MKIQHQQRHGEGEGAVADRRQTLNALSRQRVICRFRRFRRSDPTFSSTVFHDTVSPQCSTTGDNVDMPYPEMLVIPMREDLTKFGLEEARTPADVDRILAEPGTTLMVVNSVCGCAAGRARPGIGMALQHSVKPDRAATVFAGADEAAVAHLRNILSDFPPSSPSIALFKDGKPVYMVHRRDIEPRQAPEIAQLLTSAFDQFCAG